MLRISTTSLILGLFFLLADSLLTLLIESCYANDQVNILTHTAEVNRSSWQSKTINKLQEMYEDEDMCQLYGRTNEALGAQSCGKQHFMDISMGPKCYENTDSIVGDSSILKSQGKEGENMNEQQSRSTDLEPSRAYIEDCTLKCSASPKSNVSVNACGQSVYSLNT